jgi:cytochrome oxidase Cu insertion factor (SCO1/SenC/PrrC family)
MKRSKSMLLAALLGALTVFLSAASVGAVEVGQAAPDFELDSTAGGKLKLSNLKGKNVLINFYVLDYSPT